ncbi:MAG TPA: zf-HC2 domain-containing protein [Gemmatimonadaceae bacterium]|jgi:hypothetical protein|nr:zf-HC2 domain-containing protein [Gemmatimonadaceae bacterium]
MTTSNPSNFSAGTCAEFVHTLADFLEREVSESTRAAMEAHALACADCGGLLADLRKLRLDAANLPQLGPSRDLWAGVAARIETPVVAIGIRDPGLGTRRKRHIWIGLAAAGLVAVTATITHEITKRSVAASTTFAVAPVVVRPNSGSDSTVPASTSPASSSRIATSESRIPTSESRVPSPASRVPAQSRLASNVKPSVEQTYDSEIKRLRTIVNQRRGVLDTATVGVIDRNLRIIDDAIAQCRLALRKDPNSRFLSESLNDALDSKVQLLRTAAALPARM